jgi:hypothetical protein
MANVGECLAIAAQITANDRDSWYQLWAAFGSRLKEQADAAVQAGHTVSARGAYLRAAEYFRGRQLFDHLTCPKEFRLFTQAEGAAGHCEGMAPIAFWTAAFDWLDHTMS